jgi:rhomboid protease GluP
MEGETRRGRSAALRARVAAAPATYALAAANVAAFLWVEAHGSTTDAATMIRFGALDVESVRAGEWWRLLTAPFLHFGLLHLGANLFFGVPWCAQLERAIRARRFVALYVVSAVAGCALSLLGSGVTSAGASGALFGVIGAMLALHRRVVGTWGAFLANRGARLVLGNLALLAIAGIWLPLDQFAHAGGFLTGAAMAWVISRPAPRRARAWIPLALAVGALVAAAVWPDRQAMNGHAVRRVEAALEANDTARARRLFDAARARGAETPSLEYYEALILYGEGRRDAAVSSLIRAASSDDAAVREAARRALEAVRADLIRECDGRHAAACALAERIPRP